jgi:hypothetical protein
MEEKSPKPFKILGEQDGAPERILKGELRSFFQRSGNISQAFLARLQYLDRDTVTVSLCLRTSGEGEDNIAEGAAKIFSRLFKTDEIIDITFLDSASADLVSSKCQSFI